MVYFELIVVFTGMKYQINKLNRVQSKTCLKYRTITYYSRLMRLLSMFEKTVYKEILKSKSAMPSCSRYLARVIYTNSV